MGTTKYTRKAVGLLVGALVLSVTHAGTAASLPDTVSAVTCSSSYTVAAGDSWSSIGDKFNVATGDLVRANGGTSISSAPDLHPGQSLCIPAGPVPRTSSTPTTAPATPRASAPTSTGGTCQAGQVAATRGDGWWALARRAGVSMTSLLSANAATVDTPVVRGACYKLPTGGTQAPTPSSAPTQPAATQPAVTVDTHGCPKPRRGLRLCAVYEAGSPKGWSFIIDSSGATVRGGYGSSGAGRSVSDSDGAPGGGDDITPMGTFSVACYTERTTANTDTDFVSDGVSCDGWPASPGLRHFHRFNGVMGVHMYGVTRAESHGCLRSNLADDMAELGVRSIWIGEE